MRAPVPCSGFNFIDNAGLIVVIARDTATGLDSNTLQIPVSVTVSAKP